MHIRRYGQSIEVLGNRYIVKNKLGEGGMAEVFLAYDKQHHHKVAIKLLKEKRADEQMQNRFIKEAGQTVSLQHPHILRVYDHALTHQIDQGRGKPKAILFYMVMEYASGGNLQRRLTAGEPYSSLVGALTIFRQMCGAVHYAHMHRIIHRDIKPSNILFRQPRIGPEEAVLSDFGFAVQVDASHHTYEHAGTPAYMAPEQLRGQAVPASDIFALGVTLYVLCTGVLPYAMLAGSKPLSPSQLNSTLPSELDAPILRALQADPLERYRNADLFWDTIVTALAQTRLASEAGLMHSSASPTSTHAPDLYSTKPILSVPTEAIESGTSTTFKIDKDQQQGFSNLVRRASRMKAISASHPRSPDLSKASSAIPLRRSAPTLLRASGHVPTKPVSVRYAKKLLPPAHFRPPRFAFPLVGIVLLFAIAIFLLPMLLVQNAHVTLIPRSQVEQKTMLFSIGQVHAHQISARLAQSATSPATGTIPANSAQGNLLFQNDTPNPITLQSMTFTGKSGMVVSFTGPVTIPPPFKSIPAFAVQAGAAGNIPPLDIMQTVLTDTQGNTQLFVKNVMAFAGGSDALPNHQVQQSDIDQAAASLIVAQKQEAQAQLAAQVQHNEQTIVETLDCQPTVSSNATAGAQTTSVLVSVAVTCTEEVYDRASAQMQITRLLNAQVPVGYILSGQVAINELGMSGANTIQIHGQGQWFYQFSPFQIQHFALLITGKSQEQARMVLIQQPGVADAHISGPATLPSVARIQIQVRQEG